MSRGLGPTQRRLLTVLAKHAESPNEGLPVGKLKALVGGERSNVRRAIRGLLRRGSVEEVMGENERALRLTFWGALWAALEIPRDERKDGNPMNDRKPHG